MPNLRQALENLNATLWCQWPRCGAMVTVILVFGCIDEHIYDRRLCAKHGGQFKRDKAICLCGKPVIEWVCRDLAGKQITVPEFYLGEWVGLAHGEVVAHDYDVMKLMNYMKDHDLDANYIYRVEG